MGMIAAMLALCIVLAVPGLLPGQGRLRISGGVQESQVVQRDGGSASILISGESDGDGAIAGSIASRGRAVGEWTGRAANGAWSARFEGVPVGGPYRITVRQGNAEAAVDQVYVGDIWVLAGQSNMVGRARMDRPEQPHEQVRMQMEDGKWKRAEEPLHERKEGPDGEALGAGPGLTFAREMVERTGVPIGLIPCAKGGTNLTQWDPAKKGLGREALYGALIERVAAAGGRVAGVLWYQGEADSRDTRAGLYAERFRQLVTSLRADLRAPGLPFYYAQLARFAGEELSGHTVESEEIVREAQRKAESEIANTRMVATIDLELGDHIHLDAAGQRRMGRRFAAIVCSDRFPGLAACAAAKRGPRPAGLSWESPYLLRIRFADVNGALRSSGRVLGFSIADEAGRARQLVFRADIQGADVVLSFNRLYPFPRRISLWYGRGFDPACNLTDESDLAAPAFGPVELPQRPRGNGDKDAVNP